MKTFLLSILILVSFNFNTWAASHGYYQEPDIHGNKIVFVSDDDLWIVKITGGNANRLTNLSSKINSPVFSPDGTKIAFVSNHHGPEELYIMDIKDGNITRHTYLGSNKLRISGWYENNIYFTSNHKQPFLHESYLYSLNTETKTIEKVNIGPVKFYSQNKYHRVIQRRQYSEFSYWKSYKGGAIGDIWIDSNDSKFQEIGKLESNISRPIIIGDRIYFLSDKDNIGRIYSIDLSGKNLKQHSYNENYYIRNIRSDGKKIVYSSAGDIYTIDLDTDKVNLININLPSSKNTENFKFINAKDFIEHYSPNPTRDYLGQIIRGHAVMTHYFNGTSFIIGNPKLRYKILEWSGKGKNVILTVGFKDSDCIQIYDVKTLNMTHNFNAYKFGRIVSIISAHNDKKFIAVNDHGEIFLVNYSRNNNEVKKIDKAPFGIVNGVNWTSDDLHITYSVSVNANKDVIKIYSVKSNSSIPVTVNNSENTNPIFDGQGKYVYFLSSRDLTPYQDMHDGRLFFPMYNKPYLMTLNRDIHPPFNNLLPSVLVSEPSDHSTQPSKAIINLKNAYRRVIPFPIQDALYYNIYTHGNKLWFLMSLPKAVNNSDMKKKSLMNFNFKTGELELVADNIDDAILTKNGEEFLVRIDREFYAISSQPGSGINLNPFSKSHILNNPNININLPQEWNKIFHEAWANQKDRFYNPRNNEVDWDKIYNKYKQLLSKVNTRMELNDLIWEMQGELKTSHAYVFGGDFKPTMKYFIPSLGCEFVYNPEKKAYVFQNIILAEHWNLKASSPLKYPGVRIRDGDLLYSINNHKLDENFTPEMAMMNIGKDQKLMLEVAYQNGKNRRFVNIFALENDHKLKYKEYVNNNREYVKKKTDNRIGYIHIPDMSSEGYTEFFKSYLKQFDSDGLIIDTRYNTGGNVSSLILEILLRKRIGFTDHKIFGKSHYMRHASKGNYVLLINQYTASDGDKFANAFRLLRLGRIIGKRSWGGTIGIRLDRTLVDGALTSQPEFATWFADTSFDLENYGVDPDIEIENTPEDYMMGRDAQLDRAIEEILKVVEHNN